MSNEATTDPREKDVLNVLRSVTNISPNSHYNPNGADESTCPFCYERVYYMDADMSEINHSQSCTYLIAKDLLTNI